MRKPRREWAIASCLGSVLLLGACGEESAKIRETGDPPPPLATSTTSDASTSASEDDASTGEPCFLAAVVDPFADDPPATFECRDHCIVPGEVTVWCEGDASCCGDAVCSAAGLCVLEDEQTASGTD